MALSDKHIRHIISSSLREEGATAAMAFHRLVKDLSRSYGGLWPPEVRDSLEVFRREFFWFVNHRPRASRW